MLGSRISQSGREAPTVMNADRGVPALPTPCHASNGAPARKGGFRRARSGRRDL